ncbi:hypothetical protein EYC84_007470 [Monilinia fructicola]|uniref:Dolichol phosphate-mannose biosynthesis regulatory protein n=1 Tax=Monilinia fructicola TaxID=38448 RepID=A0A5M9JI87_MONFR|nr:hypothetical protein EYC84_007470 [Monilinia fructicola]
MLDQLVGLAMLVAASVVFLYYTIWTLLMPFVDSDHPLQNVFPPRVWAIRIPVILILLASAVVGSFLSVVMIRSNRKKAAKAKAASKKKAQWEPMESPAQIVERMGMISSAFARNLLTVPIEKLESYVVTSQSGWFNVEFVFIKPFLPKQ